MPDHDIDDSIETIHEHLIATAELPIDREANRWIGEAEAVVADLVGADVDRSVLERRLGHVADLLGHVEETGNDDATAHVQAATQLTDQTLAAIETG